MTENPYLYQAVSSSWVRMFQQYASEKLEIGNDERFPCKASRTLQDHSVWRGSMMEEEILQLLREHSSTFLSGEEISRRLKVTRTAVWKRIQRLRTLGYEIEASTRSGYRLIRSPDLLTPSEIKSLFTTKWMGKSNPLFPLH